MPKTKKKEQEKAVFDPSKPYKWEPTAQITFTGAEFDVMQAAIGSFVGHPITVASIVRLVDASNVLRAKIQEYVENGTMTPVEMHPELRPGEQQD